MGVSRLLETQSRLSLARTLLSLSSMDTSILAQPILELACVPPSMLTSLAGPRSLLTNSRLAVRNSMCSPVEPVENLVVKQAAPTTSPTSIVLDTLRFNLSRFIDAVNTLWAEDLELAEEAWHVNVFFH